MRDDNKYQEKFLETMKRKIPHSATLANTLTDILDIDKDSLYRRLRGEIPFTFHEALSIAQDTGISLDNVIGTACGNNLLFQLPLIDYTSLTDDDYQMLYEYRDVLEVSRNGYSEFAEASNSLPTALYLNYSHLTRFFLFKWSYRNSTTSDIKPYDEIQIPKKFEQMLATFLDLFRRISATYFLWNHLIFQHLIMDIQFFLDMKLITSEEVQSIKNELHQLLEYIYQLCETGQYKETGNKVSIYITGINHSVNCSYFDLAGQKISLFKVFSLNAISTTEEEMFGIVKKLILSMARSSTIITISNEKERIAFFNAQKEILERI